MGTRNLTIVYSNGEYKVAQYGQWDGYPEGLGVQLLKYLKGININELRNAVNDCTYLSKEDFDEINKNIDEAKKDNPRFSWQKFYPELSRDTGGDILELIMFKNKTKLQNSLNFAADSLFCEWAYVIDLDKNTYEVYEGFNKEPLDESERFYFLTPIAEKEYRENPKEYYPVKFVTELLHKHCTHYNNPFSGCQPYFTFFVHFLPIFSLKKDDFYPKLHIFVHFFGIPSSL